MKKISTVLGLLAVAVFSLPASGNREGSQYPQPGTADPPPIDLLLPQEVERATFALG
ncbi:MAG: hypothetical protein JW760_09350 [Spirochaetales bacterium]|nr:hypothetical protein [Spirochaetales bacterium]